MPFSPVELIGVIIEEVGRPAAHGGPGSALYAVPIRLSRSLSADEAQLMTSIWDRPPQFTTMHRPGIARVSGDRFVLDGTTVDEVASYHAKTLAAVVKQFNIGAAELSQLAEEQADTQRRAEDERRRHVEATARDIRFG